MQKSNYFQMQTEIYTTDITPFYSHIGIEFQYPVFSFKEAQKIFIFPNYGELIPEARNRVAIYIK